MARDIQTFSEYIHNKNTFNTIKFLHFFKDYIDELPNKMCSSKIIYNLLKNSLIHNDYNTVIFRDTFNEYFEYKLKKCTSIYN